MKKNIIGRSHRRSLLMALIITGLLFTARTGNLDANDQKESGQAAAKEIRGIDVSHFSGTVDWAKVKAAGYSFAFAKATEGEDAKDPMFDSHWTAIKKAGLICGAYHFYVTEDDPEKQANFFISSVTLEKGDLAPVVDIEIIGKNTKPGLTSRLQTFLDILQKHYGIKPIIYTDPGFWNTNMNDKFGGFPLWLAEYGVKSPKIPKGWTCYHLWQYKGDAKVPGVEKSADLSVLNSKKNLSTLLIK